MTEDKQYRAVRGRIICEVIPNEDQTASGLFVVNNTELPVKAKVLSVGASYKNLKGKDFHSPCKVGDTIYYKRYSQNSLEHHGREGLKSGNVVIWFEDVMGLET